MLPKRRPASGRCRTVPRTIASVSPTRRRHRCRLTTFIRLGSARWRVSAGRWKRSARRWVLRATSERSSPSSGTRKTTPRFYYPDTDEGRAAYIKDATAAIDRIKSVLPKYFGVLPKADLVVKRVEPFREQPGAAQHYFPSTPDGSRPGVYYAHLADMKAMPKSELEVIAYHEGLPGHHMQIAIAQELTTIPTFRRQAGFTLYIEGWALYSEWLAREMPGTYQDPYSRFGRLGLRDLASDSTGRRHRPARERLVGGSRPCSTSSRTQRQPRRRHGPRCGATWSRPAKRPATRSGC